MKRTILCLALAAFGASPAAAAPAPPPASEGPITDALRVQRLLPNAPPPAVSAALMTGDGVELERPTLEMVEETRVRKLVVTVPRAREETANVVGEDGKAATVKRLVTEYVQEEKEEAYKVSVARATGGVAKARWDAKSCKFFTVTKDGKLEALDAGKAAGMLKTRTAVLTGASAEVDPRILELVKPGTLYLVVPQGPPAQPTPPPPAPGKDSE